MKKSLLTFIVLLCTMIHVLGQATPFVDATSSTNSITSTAYGGWYGDFRQSIFDTSGLWVDQTNGNDGNNGAYATPFKTMQKAANSASNSDSISIKAGYYVEVVTNKFDNVSWKWVEQGKFGGFFVSNNNVIFDGNNLGEATGTNVVQKNIFTQQNGVITIYEPGKNITIKNMYISSPNTSLDSNGICNVASMMSVTNYTQNTISNIVLSNLKFTNAGFHAMGIRGVKFMVTNCFFSDPTHGWDAIRFFCNNSSVIGNVFSNWSNLTNDNHPDVIQAFSNNGEQSTNVLFANNYAIDCNGTQMGEIQDGSGTNIHHWTFLNNIYVRVSNQLNIHIHDCDILYNTFYLSNTNGSIMPLNIQYLNDGIHGDPYNATLYGNIFYGGGVQPFNTLHGWYLSQLTNNLQLNGFTANYNFVCDPTNGLKATTGNTYAWGTFGDESNGVNGGYPSFVNTNSLAPSGFGLQAGSPLIGIGTNLSALGFTKDYFGNPRPSAGSNWTFGAIQPQ